jgi:uncharacterized membrane protein YheB (UPF0754 family)
MSFNPVLRWLPWILPPLLGAIIGYVTNALAIRMLFRPLTEKRLFGVRIPLTPGVIPKQRRALAESIGRMVSERLITEESLDRQIDSEGFQTGIRESVSILSDEILSTRLDELQSRALSSLSSTIQTSLAELLWKFFNSKSFIHATREAVSQVVNAVSSKRLDELIEGTRLRGLIEDRIYPLVLDGRTERWAREAVRRWLNRHIARNTSIEELIPQDWIRAAVEAFESLFPQLARELMKWLRSESMRGQMESRGRFLLRDILDRLNVVQKLVISMGQFDRTLEENMPEIVEEALASLERGLSDSEVRDGLVKTAQKAVAGWQKRGIFDFSYESGLEIEREVVALVTRLFEYLRKPEVRLKIGQRLGELFEAQRGKSLRELLGNYLGFSESELIDLASERVLSFVTRWETSASLSQRIASLVSGFVAENGERRLGDFLGIDDEKRLRMEDFLVVSFVGLLKEHLSGLVKSFNIRELVVNKINQLEVAQVESLLLMVIAKHLKWINVFGALLGATIGFSQIILRLLTTG